MLDVQKKKLESSEGSSLESVYTGKETAWILIRSFFMVKFAEQIIYFR